MARQLGVGVDFGGTKLLAGVVDLATGEVLATAKKKTDPSEGPKAVLDRLDEVVASAIKSAGVKANAIQGIGVGIAGQVDADAGIMLAAPNLSSSVVNLPIATFLREKYGVRSALRNDVQIAAAGELAFGAGRECESFVCCFVGTGVGGAVVQNGVLLAGAAGSAGEIGHLVVDAGGRLCCCGGHGHLEAYSSRTAITKSLLGDLKRGRRSILRELLPDVSPDAPGGTAIRSGVLAKAVEADDELTVETIHEAGRYLGLGLASVLNLLNPARIVLGGGVIEAVDLLFDVATNHCLREALPTAANSVEIVRAELGDHSGIVGAALIGSRAGKK